MASKLTKDYRIKYWILQAIDKLALFAPLIIYFFIALCDGGVTTGRKVAVVGTVIIALMLTIFNVITRHHLRSPLWVILIGLYVAVKNLLPLIIIIAIATIADEFILMPLIKTYKIKLESSKVYDEHKEEESNGW